ncbi:MAG: hypothetical protein FWF20_11760 [Betaproteobacteria bacterium]|nr:hypothetical protein [Betaproteobacteria bacterium]MCL2887425.1 hypothetical protein [Betaproteobacteria bacterium]
MTESQTKLALAMAYRAAVEDLDRRELPGALALYESHLSDRQRILLAEYDQIAAGVATQIRDYLPLRFAQGAAT